MADEATAAATRSLDDSPGESFVPATLTTMQDWVDRAPMRDLVAAEANEAAATTALGSAERVLLLAQAQLNACRARKQLAAKHVKDAKNKAKEELLRQKREAKETAKMAKTSKSKRAGSKKDVAA